MQHYRSLCCLLIAALSFLPKASPAGFVYKYFSDAFTKAAAAAAAGNEGSL